jgi:hypothetical protein
VAQPNRERRGRGRLYSELTACALRATDAGSRGGNVAPGGLLDEEQSCVSHPLSVRRQRGYTLAHLGGTARPAWRRVGGARDAGLTAGAAARPAVRHRPAAARVAARLVSLRRRAARRPCLPDDPGTSRPSVPAPCLGPPVRGAAVGRRDPRWRAHGSSDPLRLLTPRAITAADPMRPPTHVPRLRQSLGDGTAAAHPVASSIPADVTGRPGVPLSRMMAFSLVQPRATCSDWRLRGAAYGQRIAPGEPKF